MLNAIDRTDRVAIQLGHDTKTVGVGRCYHYYYLLSYGAGILGLDVGMIRGLAGTASPDQCPSRDRDVATPLQEDKKNGEDGEEARKFHQMSHRDSDVRWELHSGIICTC